MGGENNDKLRGKERKEKNISEGLAQPRDVGVEEIAIDAEEQTKAITDIFDDISHNKENVSFDLNFDYDDQGNSIPRDMTKLPPEAQDFIDNFRDEKYGNKFLQFLIKSFNKSSDKDRALWGSVFTNTNVGSYFDQRSRTSKEFSNLKNKIVEEDKKQKALKDEQEKIEKAKTFAEKILLLIDVEKNEFSSHENLVWYDENFLDLQSMLGKSFEEFIETMKESLVDMDKDQKALYDKLLTQENYNKLQTMVGSIDTILHGHSLEDLLKDIKDKTPEEISKYILYKKSLHRIFHVDPLAYASLVEKCGSPDPAVQSNAMKLPMAYALLNDIKPQSIKLRKEADGIVCFDFYGSDGRILSGTTGMCFGLTKKSIDSNTQKVITSYVPCTPQDMLDKANSLPQWTREAYFSGLPVQSAGAKQNDVSSKKSGTDKKVDNQNAPAGPFDALSALFRSKAFRDFQVLVLAAFGSGEGKEIQINYLNSLNGVEDYRKTLTPDQKKGYGYTKSEKDGGVGRLMAKMSAVPFATEGGRGPKQDQVTAFFPGSEQDFFTEVLSDKEKIEFCLDMPKGVRKSLRSGKNEQGVPFIDFYNSKGGVGGRSPILDPNKKTETTEKPVEGISLVDNKAVVNELKTTTQSAGSVELKKDGDKEYLLIDGQGVGLVKNSNTKEMKGYIQVNIDGVQTLKKIIISQIEDDKKIISVTNALSEDNMKAIKNDPNYLNNQMQIANKRDMAKCTQSPADGERRAYFIANACVFTDMKQVTPIMQGLMAKLQADIMSVSTQDFSKDKLTALINDAKKSLVEEAGKITNIDVTKGPTKDIALTTINTWYATFKLD